MTLSRPLLAAGLLLLAAPAHAEEKDPWLGRDKALHFGASAVLAGGGYGVGAMIFDARRDRALLGGAVALSAGVGKELYDLTGAGNASYRDLTWDVVGTGVGLLLAWSLDLLLDSGDEAKPSEAASFLTYPGGRGVAWRW